MQARSKVTYHGSFFELQERGDVSVGEVVLLGGKVIETDPGGMEAVILHLPLDSRERTGDYRRSQGRYVIRHGDNSQAVQLRKGQHLAVVGRIVDIEYRTIGDPNNGHPVIEPMELEFLSEPKWYHPRFFFTVESSGGF
jgi:starvation-inducible outer membrane lipoprotein